MTNVYLAKVRILKEIFQSLTEFQFIKMAILALEGMQFFCFHGYYKEERDKGGNYSVDVFMDIPDDFGISDKLETTINYEEVYAVCSTIMSKPVYLIEHLAHEILSQLKSLFPEVVQFRIKISKHHPPLKGEVKCTSIEVCS
jgi:dihydroneopterin aldolase